MAFRRVLSRNNPLTSRAIALGSANGTSTPHCGYVINRTKFHKAVISTFEDWIAELRGGERTLREKMRLRMDEIITKHYGI
jgi:hypothetical protein